MKTYGVGAVGCGAVWNYHRLVYDMSDRLKCVCVYDPTEERKRDAAERTGARAAESAEDVLTAVEAILLVGLCTSKTQRLEGD